MNELETIFRLILANSWRVGLVVLGLLAIRRLALRRIPAAAIHLAWVLVGVRLLLPAGIPSEWSPYRLMQLGRAIPAIAGPDALPTPLASGKVGPHPAINPPGVAPTKLAALAWLAGAILLLAWRFAADWYMRRAFRRESAASDPRLVEFARPLPVVVTQAVSAPALRGILKPTLLFPPGLAAKLGDDELRLVVSHELGHFRRRDLVSKAIIELATIVHWFNPVVWIAQRYSRIDCELACDEHVLRRERAAGQAAYGATLLKVLSLEAGPQRLAHAVGILEDKEQLKQRLQMIIAYRNAGAGRFLAGAGFVALLAAFALTQETKLRAATPAPATPGSVPTALENSAFSALRAAALSIGIRDDGFIVWNGERVSFEGFVDRLGAIGAGPRPVVNIYAGETVTVAAVTKAMDALRKAGLMQVRFALDPSEARMVSEEVRQAAQAAEKAARAARADAAEIARRMEELRQELAVKQVDQRRADQAIRQVQEQMARVKADSDGFERQRYLDQSSAQLAETRAMTERTLKAQQDNFNADRAYAAARAVEQARIDAEQQQAATERQLAALKAQLAQPPATAP